MAQKTRTRARMCLLGVSLTLLPILGVKSPENPNIGAWIDVFKPNGQNIESFMLSKLLHRFQPNFAPFFHQVVVVGGPNRRPTNPRWRTAAILKKSVKSLYLCNRLTDFDKIWYSDAYWPLTVDRPLKFRIFENPKWRQSPSWEITKRSRYLRNGLTDLYEIWYADAKWVS